MPLWSLNTQYSGRTWWEPQSQGGDGKSDI